MSLEVVFLEVLNTSLLVSMIACVIMIIRVLFKRVIPKVGLYMLWSIVLIRLVVPISIPSPMSLFNAMPQTGSVPSVENETFSKVTIVPSIKPSTTPETRPNLEVDGDKNETIVPNGNSGEVEVTPPIQPQESISVMVIISYMWLAGTGVLLVGLLTWYTITYLRLKQTVRVSELEALNKCKAIVGIKRDVSIYVSDLFSTPVVFGLIKPKIIVPRTFDLSGSQSVMHMLTHELVHIKRFDHVTKLLSQMLLCVHWFNPLMWLSYRMYEGDMESSCDESVLRLSGDDIRGDYATSLLNLAKQQQDHTMRSSFVAFGESDLKKRVKGIMGYKNRTVFSIVLAVLIIGLVGCSLLSNPVGEDKNPETGDKPEENNETLNEVSALNGGGFIDISFAGYDIVADPLDPTKEGISIFFERKNTGPIQLSTKNVEGEVTSEFTTTNLQVSYDGKVLDDMSYGVPAEQEIYPPEYKNVYGCAWEATLLGGESDVCYMFYSYNGDGEYIVEDLNKENDESYLSVDISEETKVDEFYATKYSKEEGIYTSDSIERLEYETKPYLALGEKISILEDDVEIGTVSVEGYEVFQDRSGRKGVAFFFNETNTSDSESFSGANLIGSSVFYEDIYLSPMHRNAPYGTALTEPKFEDVNACAYMESLAPGESRTCYEYYSYVDSGEYLITLGTEVGELQLHRIIGAPYKSYLIEVE